ncbi:MAG: thiamine-phosphate kinase [Thermoprotei archaeon]
MKLGDLGEKKIIEEIIAKYITSPSWEEHLEPLDDARDILPAGPRILFSIDGYSLEKAKLPWRGMSDLGWCSIVGAISDHIAKTGIPRDVVISLGLPRDTPVDDLIDFMNGVREAIQYYNLRLLGGDLNESREPWVSVAVIGYTSAKKPPGRCCGKPGDLVIVTGVYGAMGYVVLRGIEDAAKEKWVVEATRRPKPYVETAVVLSSYYKSVHASMDVSDGLGYTLLELARRMGKGIVLTEKPRYHGELDKICDSENCIWKHILNGGEEYGVVAIVSPQHAETIYEYLLKLEVPAQIIGRVEDKPPHLYLGDQVVDDLISVWDQFKEWDRR